MSKHAASDAFAALFAPGEVVGFSGPKDAPFRSWGQPAAGSVYFCINPLTENGAPLRNEFIAEARNFLVEFDKTKLPSQRATIKKVELPYNTLTFSGGKSLQAIVSLSEPCVDEAEYKKLFRLLVATVPNIDENVGTLSRLARIPNATREGGAQQKLIAVANRKLTKRELLDWAYRINCQAFRQWEWDESEKLRSEQLRAEYKLQRAAEPAPEQLPGWVQYALDTGKLKDYGRHEMLTKVASGLAFDGHDTTRIEAVLYQLQAKIGLDRDDVPGIISWLERKF